MEGSSWKAWGSVAVLILGMFGALLWLRPEIKARVFGPAAPSTASASAQAQASNPKQRHTKNRKKRRKPSQANGGRHDARQGDRELVDDYESEDRFPMGEIGEPELDQEQTLVTEPEYVPPPEVYQPDGKYTPIASWQGSHASDDATEISMNGGPSSPLTPSQIRGTITSHLLMPCYEEIARRVPQMAGVVHFKVQVEGDGRVSKVRVTSSRLRSRTVEQCMVDRIRKVRFPESIGSKTTRFDIDFTFQ